MNIKSFLSLLGVLFLLYIAKLLFWPLLFPQSLSPNIPLPVVAISQIIEHPSLDQEREGIYKALEEAGYQDGKNIKIIYQNAQGNLGVAAQLLCSF